MSSSSGEFVKVQDLAKRFGELRAVDGLSFSVAQGEIFGLLGPNGAGKTTTLSMMAGLLTPDRGTIHIDGADFLKDPLTIKRRLGVVPQETAIYEELTALENTRFWASMYGLKGRDAEQAVTEILELVGLSGRAKEPVRQFSGGMKRRLNLALGLVHKPDLILLDEPTVGIDPQARLNILEVVREKARAGAAIIYTTHHLEEAESLCDRIGIMDKGKSIALGTLDELQAMVGGGDLLTVRGTFDAEELRRSLEAEGSIEVLSLETGKISLLTSDQGRGAIEALTQIMGRDLDLDGISIQPPSLNSLFLKLTGRELRD